MAGYRQLRKTLDPFCPFLTLKLKFEWTDELQLAFEVGKLEIVKAIKEGVEIFDPPHLHTCMCTDWSKEGVGYYLCQKVCRCEGADLACSGVVNLPCQIAFQLRGRVQIRPHQRRS